MTNLLEKVSLLNLYLQPIYCILTITLNTLSIRVLRSRALRSSPCTYYLVANAVFNMIYTVQICPLQISRSFNYDWKNSPIGCKIISYFPYLSATTARTMLVLAAFDRYCATSLCTRLQLKNKVRESKFVIISSAILLAIDLSPLLIIYHFNEHSQICKIYKNLSIDIYVFIQISFHCIIDPLLMITFGILSINNIHKHKSHLRRFGNETHFRRTDAQLARMLFLQIGVHLILSIPYGIVYILHELYIPARTPDVKAVRRIFVLWQQIDYFIPFFLYVVSGSVYREELFKIISKL